MTTHSELTAHIAAIKQATEIIKNAYRFIDATGSAEETRYLCATIQDHIDSITALTTEVPTQMRSYEMMLEYAKEFALIPEGATPIETADILKEMLTTPELIRRQAGVVDTQFAQARSPALVPVPVPVPGYNYETRMGDITNTYKAIFADPKEPKNLKDPKNRNMDIDICSIMSPPQQNEYYHLAPRKLFSDEFGVGGMGEE